MNRAGRKLVRQPNGQRFNGYCFTCNKFCHMATQCRSRMNPSGPSFSG